MLPLLSQPPEALCLIRLSAIGDCCHTLPVVRTLQARWPETRITWIIGRTEYGLMQGVDGVEFITFDKRHRVGSLREIRRKLARRRFPVLLHMHASMRANLISLLVDADLRLGFDRHRARDFQWLFTNRKLPAVRTHVMDGLFSFIEALGIDERMLRWDIPVSPEDEARAEAWCGAHRPVCVISPCSSQRFRNYRNWRVENYAAVARHLVTQRGARVLITGGNTELEHEYGQALAAAVGSGVENLVGRTTLKQLLAILTRADLLICPDSGPAHMATAAGTPVVGLYATSNRQRTGPYLSQALVVDKYPQAVARELGRPLDELRWGQRVRRPDAMDLIETGEVIEKVDAVLDGRLRPAVAERQSNH